MMLMGVLGMPGSGCTALAQAVIQEHTIALEDISYAGEWWTFEGTNLSLYLPEGWEEIPAEAYAEEGVDLQYVVGAADGTAIMALRVMLEDFEQVDTGTYVQVAQALENSGLTDVTIGMLNGKSLITYMIGGDIRLGGMFLADDAYLVFEFEPATADGVQTFMEILSTVEVDGSLAGS